MTRSLRSAWLRRRTAVLLATATVAASFGWALAPGPSSSAQTADPPFTVEVSQTSGLLDGDLVEVTVRADSGDPHRERAHRTTCSSAGRASRTRPSADLARPRPATVRRAPRACRPPPRGRHRSTPWPTDRERRATSPSASVLPNGRPGPGLPNATLECGTGAPCLLVVKVPASVGGGADDRPLRHRSSSPSPRADPNAGCGSRNPAAVSIGRIRPHAGSLGALDPRAMQLGGVGGRVDVSSHPTGEGEGLAAFCERRRAIWLTRPRGIGPSRASTRHRSGPAVYTPVALNAVVIAAMGGGQVVNDDPAMAGRNCRGRTPQPIRMTAAEAATLSAKGQFFLSFSSRGPDVFLARTRSSDRGVLLPSRRQADRHGGAAGSRPPCRCSRRRSSTLAPPIAVDLASAGSARIAGSTHSWASATPASRAR